MRLRGLLSVCDFGALRPRALRMRGEECRFLANVDPVDLARATHGLDPASTLVVIISKTFTTAETMLNARSIRKWLKDSLKSDEAVGAPRRRV